MLNRACTVFYLVNGGPGGTFRGRGRELLMTPLVLNELSRLISGDPSACSPHLH